MKLLIITPHLSTGGSPQYLYEYLLEFSNKYSEIKLVEFTNFSSSYVIQKEKIKKFLGEDNVICLGNYGVDDMTWFNDKSKIHSVITDYDPDVVWMNEFPEAYEYKFLPESVVQYIYRKNRKYQIFETTHYNSFDFSTKKYFGDKFMFCSTKHLDQSKQILNIEKEVWETPIRVKERPNREETLLSLNLDPNKIHILNVGLFNTNKNQKYIYDIAQNMINENVEFHFIGNDCFINETGITEDQFHLPNCRVWGERGDVDLFMSCMDMYLFPSKKELNPLTVREALSWDMNVYVNRDENYVHQYKDIDNFHILDEVNIESEIRKIIESKKTGKFLVVCSIYNKSIQHLEKSINSLLNQTYKNWTLVLADDFSDPNYSQSIKEFIESVQNRTDNEVIHYQPKYKYELYLYQNFFSEYEYDFFFDLDSDDEISSNILEMYSKHYIKYPEVHSIFSDYKKIENDRLTEYSLVKPFSDPVREFNIRTNSPNYMSVWEKSSSWNMFGHGRSFRKTSLDKFEIVKKCRTATDSMTFFNTLLTGNHLHLPMTLYTYERIEGSDSYQPMGEQDLIDYNANTLHALSKYDGTYKPLDIYEDVYLETSALIMCEYQGDISLITDLTEDQQNKIKFLYGTHVSFNDFSKDNLLVISNKVDIDLLDFGKDRNLSIYKFIDGKSDNMENYLNENVLEFRSSLDIGQYRYFHYFRHFILHRNGIVEDTNTINIEDFDGIKVEIQGNQDKEYNVQFINRDTNETIHSDVIKNNMWTSPIIKYYINWEVLVNGVSVYKQNLEGKRVLISFESSSLGDTLAWIPYINEFRKRHKCHIVLSTFRNYLFKNHPDYEGIEFIEPGSRYENIHKKYKIGWFRKEDGSIDWGLVRNDFKSQELQKTSSDVLGIDHIQLRPSIQMDYTKHSPIDGKYVCIAIHGTAQSKYWNNLGGWQKTVDHLKSVGYKVVLVSHERDGYMGNKHPNGIIIPNDKSLESISSYIKHSDLFIGISSGISWLTWAIGVPMVLISGFSEPYTEFEGDDIVRVINKSVCNGCFNTHKLDQSDWNWCPVHKGTDRQFECTKKIEPQTVIEGINHLLELN